MRNLMCGLALATAFGAVAGTVTLEEDAATGGLVSVKIAGDEAEMNWIRPFAAKAWRSRPCAGREAGCGFGRHMRRTARRGSC